MLTPWFIAAGVVALVMAYAAGQLRRAPLSSAMVYLGIGLLLGPHGVDLVDLDPSTEAKVIEWISAVVIAISIFSSALKLRVPLRDARWFEPLRLAFPTMILGVLAIASLGHLVLNLPFASALLLGATLAPTDPVLASDVQVEQPFQFHRLRFALTGEAGMNDGAVLPMITLGMLLVGAKGYESPSAWVLLDVLWGVSGAVIIGGALGYGAGRYMLHLRIRHHQQAGSDSFLALGIIALSYGAATAAGAIGFLAVFAAGVGVRSVERRLQEEPPEKVEVRIPATAEQEEATDPDVAPVFMLLRMESFLQHLEQVGEAAVVVLVGALLQVSYFGAHSLIAAAILFVVVRPASVFIGLLRSPLTDVERTMCAWFGIRGTASIYYLAYLQTHGVSAAVLGAIAPVVLSAVTLSILAHGATATPLMHWFDARQANRGESARR